MKVLLITLSIFFLIQISPCAKADWLSSIGGYIGERTTKLGKEQTESIEVPITLKFSSLSKTDRSVVYEMIKSHVGFLEGVDGITQWMLPCLGHSIASSVYEKSNPKLEEMGIKKVSGQISQAGMDDLYLMDDNRWALLVPGNSNLVFGQRINYFTIPDGVLNYQTVAGSAQRLRKVKAISKKSISFEEFSKSLSAGFTPLIVWEANVTCPKCNGEKKLINPPKQLRPRSGFQTTNMESSFCKNCKGKGKVSLPCVHIVTWQ